MLFSALRHRAFCDELLGGILRRRRFAGEGGELLASHTRAFRQVWGADRPVLEPSAAKVDQDNTTVFFGDRFALKFLRKIEEGPHPEEEIGALLTQEGFPNVPPLAGSLEYRGRERANAMVAAVLSGFVRAGHAMPGSTPSIIWALFFEHAMARGRGRSAGRASQADELAHELIGTYLETVRLLGVRTAELHVALASRAERPGLRAGTLHGFLPAGPVSRHAGTPEPRHRCTASQRWSSCPMRLRADAAAVLRTAGGDPGEAYRVPARRAPHGGPHPHSRRFPPGAGAVSPARTS